jgi:sugar lactone lactonase YvrE
VSTLVSSGLSQPWGVAVDGSGNVYIADTVNNAIYEWSAATHTVSPLVSSGISGAAGVAVDGSGNVYIGDFGNGAIKEWNASTRMVTTLVPSGLGEPTGVAVDGSGNIYIADYYDAALIERNAATQTVTTLAPSGSIPLFGVAVDGFGNVFTANTNTNAIEELPYAFVGPATFSETAAAGTDSLLPVLPITQSLTGVYAPASSDTSWLTIGTVSGGVVTFNFTANTTASARTANVIILGMEIPVTQLAGQTITFGALSNVPYGTTPFTVSATATSGLAVSFASLTPLVCTVSSGTVMLASVGKCTIEATQGGGSGFASATPVDRSFQVTAAGQTITFGALSNQPFPATGTVALSAMASSGLAVSFTSLTTAVCTVSGATVTLVATGTCAIQATQAGNAYYAAATAVDETFQVIQPALGTNAILVGSAASSSSVILSTLNAWTAVSNASFLHIATGSASGTGSAVVVFTIDAFTGTGTRTGTLTIGGLTLTVTQAGTNYTQVTGLATLVPSTAGLNWPSDVAVDGAGNVYISDSRNGMIKEWSAAAQTVSTLVSSGLADPQGLAVDGAGNVYIADYGHSEIQEWNAADGLVAVVSSGVSFPYGVAVDGSGNIYIADSGDQAGKEWTAATGTLSTLVPSGMQLPWGAAVDSAGNVYISDSNFSLIKKWSAATQTATTLVATNLNSPTGLAVDGSGNIYIANSDNSQIKLWNASTQKVTTLVSSGLNSAMGVAVDGSNNIYIADTFNNAIKELPHAFVGPISMTEQPAAGSDKLLQVLPATESLIGIFAPTSSDTSWLTIGTIANGVVSFSFTANTGTSARTANITVLGVTVPVTQLAAQTITFGALSDESYGIAPFTVSATATSGLAVSFTSPTTSVCTVSSGTVTLLSVGKCTIEATQAGNASYAAATAVDRSFQVTPASQTITFGTLANQVYGTAPFTVSATASSGLAVSFSPLTVSVCSVSSGTVTLVSVGKCTIEATEGGNANYSAATAVDQSFQVTPAQPGLAISAPTVTYGVSASVGVTVVTTLTTVPTGTVTLIVDSGAGVTKALGGGAATFSLGVLPAGSHALSVSYSGDTDYQPLSVAQAAVLLANPVLVVNKAATAVALSVSGQTATATLTVTPPGAGTPTGSVQFQRGTTVLGAVSLTGLTATLTNVTSGAVTAVYSGDGNFSGSTSPALTVYVPTSTLSIASSINPSTLGRSVTFMATIVNGGAPPLSAATGSVQFLDGGKTLATASVSGGQATYTTAVLGGGTHQIVAQYSGDGVFPAAQASYQQIVNAATAVSLSVSPAAPAYGDPVTVTATISSGAVPAGFAAPTGTVTFVLGGTAFMAGTPVATVPLSSGTAVFTFTGLAAGGNEITAEYSGDSAWSSSFLMIVVTVSNNTSTKVGEAPSITSVNLAVVGGQLVLTAAVTPAAAGTTNPTGSVQFINTLTGSVIATASLSNGTAVATGVSNAAAQPIVAVYSGDSNFASSTSAPLPSVSNAAAPLTAIFAPDEIASVYGVTGLSGDASATESLPTSLGGASVTITDSAGTARAAQLSAVYASSSQINLVIPSGTAAGLATLTIALPGGGTLGTAILVGTTAPGIFTANMTGRGVFAGQVVEGNADGSQTTLNPAVWDAVTNQYDANPISLGPAGERVFLVLYGTGLRHTGAVAASMNGVSLRVAYSGAQSQFPGLDQINLEVPASLAGAGLVNLAVTVDGQAANTVTFDIE